LKSLLYLDQDSFGGSVNPKTSYELNCKGFPYNSLNLIVKQFLKVYHVISLIYIFNQSI
jgi:hypothetical protein